MGKMRLIKSFENAKSIHLTKNYLLENKANNKFESSYKFTDQLAKKPNANTTIFFQHWIKNKTKPTKLIQQKQPLFPEFERA